jgi:hypothetical protein
MRARMYEFRGLAESGGLSLDSKSSQASSPADGYFAALTDQMPGPGLLATHRVDRLSGSSLSPLLVGDDVVDN